MSMGADLVPASKAREIVGSAIEPIVADLEQVRPGVWVEPGDIEVRRMITLDEWKGASLTIGYGITCDWIPMRLGNADPYHWPNSTKQTIKHLWVDHLVTGAPIQQSISRLAGETALRRTPVER